MRTFPPLNALRVFEVAARTGSYAAAAAELGLTHGAISRHVATLESWLGQRLFLRVGRRMVATPMGQAFAIEVGHSFDRLVAAAEACGRPGTRRLLRVSASTSFAMRWLIPRLERFHQQQPNLEVVVTTVPTVHAELRGGFDVAIRRGVADEGAWPRHCATNVLTNVDTLIMSPSLFEHHPIREIVDVERHVLLASETRPGDWSNWLEAAGLSHLARRPRRLFDHFFVTRQAVEDGLGIGVGPLPLLGIDIASSRLMAPLPHIQVQSAGYVALTALDGETSAPVSAFLEWLIAEQVVVGQI